MAANTVSPDSFRIPQRAAWWLIAVAFAIPALGFAYGAYDDVELAFTLICAAATLLVIAAVAWVVTRRSSPRTKAYVRLTVGLLICLDTSVHLVNDIRSHEAAKAYARQLSDLRQRHDAFVEVVQRYDRLDMSEALTPASLTTPEGIASGRALVGRYRKLLAERAARLDALVQSMSRVASVAPASAEETIARPEPVDVVMYATFDESEPAVAQAMEAILNWASTQQGRLRQVNGEYVFADPGQEAELKALQDKLDGAETALLKAQVSVLAQRIRAGAAAPKSSS